MSDIILIRLWTPNASKRVCSQRIHWQARCRAAVAAMIALTLAAMFTSTARAQVDEPHLIIRPQEFQTWTPPNPGIALPTFDQLQSVVIEPRLQALVRKLEDPSFEVREAATAELVQSSPDRLQLYALLIRSDLSPEQRYRLLTALRESLIRVPRGALGISMPPMARAGGGGFMEIRVIGLIPGLPAEQVLKEGDRIVQVDGQPLRHSNDLLMRVQSKRPGETVSLLVRRPQLDDAGRVVVDANNEEILETLEIDLELGSAELLRAANEEQLNQLGQPVAPSPVETLRLSEAERAQRELAPKPRPIVVDGSTTLTAPPGEMPEGASSMIDPDVEAFPLIRDLLWYRAQAAAGRYSAEQMEAVYHASQQEMIRLFRESQNRGLTRDQQNFLRLVVDRAQDLMAN